MRVQYELVLRFETPRREVTLTRRSEIPFVPEREMRIEFAENALLSNPTVGDVFWSDALQSLSVRLEPVDMGEMDEDAVVRPLLESGWHSDHDEHAALMDAEYEVPLL